MDSRRLLYHYWEVEWNGGTYYVLSKYNRKLWFEINNINIISMWQYYDDQSYEYFEFHNITQTPIKQKDWNKDDALFGTVQCFAISAKKFAELIKDVLS